MYCSNCGYNLSDSDNFCPKCGKKVQRIDDEATPPSHIPPTPNYIEEEEEPDTTDNIEEPVPDGNSTAKTVSSAVKAFIIVLCISLGVAFIINIIDEVSNETHTYSSNKYDTEETKTYSKVKTEQQDDSIKRSKLADLDTKINAAYNQWQAGLAKLKKTHDDVSGYYWYVTKKFTHYSNRDNISVYFVQEVMDGPIEMRLKISSFWDFSAFLENEKFIFYCKDNDRRLIAGWDEMGSPNSGGTDDNFNNYQVWDHPLDYKSNIYDFLSMMVNSKESKIRLQAGSFRHDITLTPLRKSAIKEIFEIYDLFLAYKELMDERSEIQRSILFH